MSTSSLWGRMWSYAALKARDAEGLILDVGSAEGAMRELKRSIVRVDIRRQNRPDIVADAHHLPIRQESAGCIAASQIVEHLDDPATFIDEASKALTPGALFIITVPSSSLWRVLYSKVSSRAKRFQSDPKYEAEGHIGHKREYSLIPALPFTPIGQLVVDLETHGFTIVDLRAIGALDFPFRKKLRPTFLDRLYSILDAALGSRIKAGYFTCVTPQKRN